MLPTTILYYKSSCEGRSPTSKPPPVGAKVARTYQLTYIEVTIPGMVPLHQLPATADGTPLTPLCSYSGRSIRGLSRRNMTRGVDCSFIR